MGRPHKPLWQHELEGTYRPDRHGPPSSQRFQFADMPKQEPDEERIFRPGIDLEFLPKMLVSAHSLSRLFDVNPATIRRWARTGVMPKPLSVGGRRLWQGDVIRKWCNDGCPDVGGQDP